MLRYILLFIVCFTSIHKSFAQSPAHNGLRIALITCSPGEELYALFGHTAIRITDSVSMTDIVYNYGTFDFNEPRFYVKFARGKLLYYLSVEQYSSFLNSYLAEGRHVTEQVLNLNSDELYSIQRFLNTNLQEENRYYHYDFFLDNCTTRPRDLLEKALANKITLSPVMPENYTYRNAIHQYLNAGKQYWSKLGIDLLLGAKTDKVMNSREQMFLPDNLMHSLDSNRNVSIVKQTQTIQAPVPYEPTEPFIKPLPFFILLALVFIGLTFPQKLRNSTLATILHKSLFFFTGILGIILVLMWWGTDHSMTKNNFNLLWAWPFHVAIPLFLESAKPWLKIYLLATIIVTFLNFAAWFSLPQHLNNALLPWLTLLIYSSVINLKK